MPKPVPTKPVRGYSFSAATTANPNAVPPGNNFDTEYDRLATAVGVLIDFVRQGIGDDGRLVGTDEKPPVALTDQATLVSDTSLSNTFTVTLGGNRVLANPTALTAGRTYLWAVRQDETGGRTLSFGSAFKFPGGVAPVLSAAAGKTDLIVGRCFDGATLLCTFTGDLR